MSAVAVAPAEMLGLLAMLYRTIAAQQEQIDALTAQLAALTADKEG